MAEIKKQTKSVTKKPATKKTTPKKVVAKKPVAKKALVKKTTPKKVVAKKSEIKKESVKKAVTKKVETKKSTDAVVITEQKETKVKTFRDAFTKNSAIIFTAFLAALFLVLVAVTIFASVNGNYGGTTTPWQGLSIKDNASLDTNDPTWAHVDSWYMATLIISVIAGAFAIWGLGGWLRGSSWINKSNTYVKGQLYVRTKAQNAVFRVVTVTIAFGMLSSFFITLFFEDLNGIMSNKSSFIDNVNFSSSSVLQAGLDYALTPSHWYYQCFLSSLFMGLALVLKKYKWVQYFLPLAFIGAFRTFYDVTDWADDASWTNVHFLRLTFVHMMIVIGPIFIMVANRYRYSLKDIKSAAIYTFFMAFGAYMLFTVKHVANVQEKVSYPINHFNGGIYDKSYGELTGVGDILGISDSFIQEHSHMFFWLVVCPFGLLIFLLFTFVCNFFYFKSQAKGNFLKRWISMWKPWYKEVVGIQWVELKQSFSFFNRADKPSKVKNTLFGIKPAEGKISEDPYVIVKSQPHTDIVKGGK